VLGQEKRPGLTPQVAFAGVMALLVLALVASVLTGRAERSQGWLRSVLAERAASVPVEAGPTSSLEPGSGMALGTVSPAAMGTSQPTPTTQPAARSTLKPADALRSDHYWLERPIVPPGESRVARYYPYGSRMDGSYPVHTGVEMVNAEGTPVLAPASGVVVAAGTDEAQVYGARAGFYGNLVVIQLDQRFQGAPVYVLFGHLSEVQVVVGQPVSVGQQVGLVGATGYAEAPHLHSEVRIKKNDYGATVNPELWYKPRAGCGTLAGALLDARGNLVDTETKIVIRSAAGTTYEVFTYPLDSVNPDPEWTENFAIGDLEAGAWSAEVFYRGTLYTHDFTIQPGQTTWLVIPTH